eukprot:8099607-Pyramimonas_sp.AAC.1
MPNASSRASSQESADRSRTEAPEGEDRFGYGDTPPSGVRGVMLESPAAAAADAVRQYTPPPPAAESLSS